MQPDLILTEAHRQQIVDHAWNAVPNEICGLIGGWNGTASLIIPIPNIAPTPQNRYLLDPKAFVRAYAQIEKIGGELIGIYHSHPASEPIPSITDIIEATWPDAVYLIVGLAGGKAQLGAWWLRAGRSRQAQIVIT